MHAPLPEPAPSAPESTTEDLLRSGTAKPESPALDALCGRLRERFGDALRAVLFYGSALRDGIDEEGLFDLVAVVDSYRNAYDGWKLRFLNGVLPPNVFYLETTTGPQKVRAKYAVISLAQLRRATRPRCLQVYFWGRLAQPVAIAHAADAAAREEILDVLAQSVRTFLSRTASLVESPFTADTLWERGLESCYRTELRAEKKGRGTGIIDQARERYRRLTATGAHELGWTQELDGADGVARYAPASRRGSRLAGRVAWTARRVQGKTLHLLRLIKATQTFEGGVDYILWKIERHSGVKVEVSERARRHPVLAGWVTLWRLRRKGGFR